MTAGNDFDPQTSEPTLFSALLTPHRSLNRTGFLVLMAFLSLISFAAGVAFLLMGAWPVFGFLGLDVLLIYWAFRANFRAARAYEEVTVTASELTVRKVSQQGIVREWTLHPVWVQLDRRPQVLFRRFCVALSQENPAKDTMSLRVFRIALQDVHEELACSCEIARLQRLHAVRIPDPNDAYDKR